MVERLALIVDGDPARSAQIRRALERHRLNVVEATGAGEAAGVLRSRRVCLCVVAHNAEGTHAELQRFGASELFPVVVTVENEHPGAAASRRVFARLRSPLEPAMLEWLAESAGGLLALFEELDALRAVQSLTSDHGTLVGHSAVMDQLRREIDRIAAADVPVVVWGEPGTGRELVGRTLHAASARRNERFTVLAGAPATGMAAPRRLGPADIEAAGRGTLYLEEPAEWIPEEQERLSALLQDHGEGARLLAALREPPQAALEAGRLIESLARSLDGAALRVPPLRERREDVALLARHFLDRIAEINRLPPIQLEADALEALERHRWPGNVRELRHAIEHAAILAGDSRVRARDLPESLRATSLTAQPATFARGSDGRFKDAKRAVVHVWEHDYLAGLLQRHGGNVTAAAKQAGMLRSALQRLLRKHGLRSAEFRPPRAPEL
ncbi:MAG TPA: sigma 54-interacting transcriptional regulator [Candidatus Polarisedimenticolaceae bacterium]|nr:sigma 54-interacting transcriptional regulator [Candidatus Polarisedimenticolaceae bacterium]